MYSSVHSSTFHINQKVKPPRCQSANEWINRMRSTRAMEYFSAVKKNEVLTRAAGTY